MMKKIFLGIISLSFVGFGSFLSSEVQAGQCLILKLDGGCAKWSQDGAERVEWSYDPGPLVTAEQIQNNASNPGAGAAGGCQLGVNAQDDLNADEAVTIVEWAFAQWTSLPNAQLTVRRGDSLLPAGQDVNINNYADHWVLNIDSNPNQAGIQLDPRVDACYDNNRNTVCVNPVIFDSSGEIIDAILGAGNKNFVYAHAFTFGENGDGIIRKAQMVINGYCYKNPACGVNNLDYPTLKAAVLHEAGHFLGLDHVNMGYRLFIPHEYANACNDPSNNLNCHEDDVVPTMHWQILPGVGQDTLHHDDKMAFVHLYPKPFDAPTANYCRVSGHVLDINGRALVGAEVVAREVLADGNGGDTLSEKNAVATTSGLNATNVKCNANVSSCSAFSIKGLKPGKTYRFSLQTFRFPGAPNFRIGINPCDVNGINTGEGERYNFCRTHGGNFSSVNNAFTVNNQGVLSDQSFEYTCVAGGDSETGVSLSTRIE